VTDPEQIWPPAPRSAADTGVPDALLEDLLAKHLCFGGPSSTEQLSDRTGLSFEVIDALSQFVLRPDVLDGLARALHSGRATLIFGASGNGKTAIIEQYARHADDTVIIPYALYIHGQIVRIFDAAVHMPAEPEDALPDTSGILKSTSRNSRFDQRWVRVRRPVVVVIGGELTQESLELSFDPVARFYQAPPHVKAQDGVFVIDDFGFEPRGAYPRDLIQIIQDSARFDGSQPTLTPEMAERAIQVYFIE
jgi:hypothetical protein